MRFVVPLRGSVAEQEAADSAGADEDGMSDMLF